MKKENKKYIRTALLKYKSISKIVDDTFINETQKSIDKLEEYPKLNPLTINDRCKKLNFSHYERWYADSLEFLKRHIKNICSSPIMSACLEYNNKQLFNDFKKLECFKDQKRKNNIYKSLTSYINRVSYNSAYGGLMGFYSTISSKPESYKFLINKLLLCFERDRFISKITSENTCNDICLNPTIIFKNNEVVYFKYENNKEQIIKINNSLVISILRAIKDRNFLIENQFNLKKATVKKDIFRKIDNNILNKIFKKMMELNLISLCPKEISEVCFKVKKHLRFQDVKLKKQITLDGNNVYDLINANTFHVDKNIYSDFKESTSIYLDLLGEQLRGIHEEKIYLGKILRKYLKKINQDKCLLLDFIVNYKDEILKLRKKRGNYCLFFYEKFFSTIKLNRTAKEVRLNNWKINNPKIRNNLEFYLSTCKISGRRYILIENISPKGVFSSRFDYLTDDAPLSMSNGSLEPIEVIFMPPNKKLFHSFRRKEYTRYYLNINNYIQYPQQNTLNVNDVCLAIDETGLPTLYSSKLNKYFDPVIHSTLPVEQSIITIFLRMISQSQEEVYDLPKLLPDRINSLNNYIPRIIVKNLVISKRTWRMPIEDINVIKGSVPKYNEYLYYIRLFKTRKIPRFVKIFSCHNNNPRPLDLYNPFSLLSFKKYNKEKFIYIEEMLPSPEHADSFDEKMGYFNQYYYALDQE